MSITMTTVLFYGIRYREHDFLAHFDNQESVLYEEFEQYTNKPIGETLSIEQHFESNLDWVYVGYRLADCGKYDGDMSLEIQIPDANEIVREAREKLGLPLISSSVKMVKLWFFNQFY